MALDKNVTSGICSFGSLLFSSSLHGPAKLSHRRPVLFIGTLEAGLKGGSFKGINCLADKKLNTLKITELIAPSNLICRSAKCFLAWLSMFLGSMVWACEQSHTLTDGQEKTEVSLNHVHLEEDGAEEAAGRQAFTSPLRLGEEWGILILVGKGT